MPQERQSRLAETKPGLRHRLEGSHAGWGGRAAKSTLSRPLTPSEQAVLRQRLATLGADRLGDVVLDMDATTLSAWLADPAAC